jgi:dihydroorotate dehydrogenase
MLLPTDLLKFGYVIATIAGFSTPEASSMQPRTPVAQKSILYGIAEHPDTAHPDRIAQLAHKLTPHIIATKTARPYEHVVPKTNTITYLENEEQLTLKDLKHPFYATTIPPLNHATISLANAVGMPSPPLETTKNNVKRAMALLKEHAPKTQLMFSVHGNTPDEFRTMAGVAKELNVPYVCANLSCPNIVNGGQALYTYPCTVAAIVSAMKSALGDTPLVIKMGLFRPHEKRLMEQVIITADRCGAYAIYGINTIKATIINRDGTPTFGPDQKSGGLSGTQIRSLALAWAQEARAIITKNKLSLRLFVCGGISTPEDFELFKPYADGIFAATAVTCNPKFEFPHRSPQVLFSELATGMKSKL